ncbi:hypothetical protein HPB50_019222 [Hyalomma asiaticum]|uniref:Uncharacterized protein n=1 Tax=Hyalomma asiaticum TaxID=266040 RepID=A0ACB7RQ66_HYAAI|nr:hypothetical protein HPB50_019222 [Hyalomma asiaticum]
MPKKRTLRLRRAKEAKRGADEMPEDQIQQEASNETESVEAEAASECSSFAEIRQELSPIFCKRELEPPDNEETDTTFATQDSLPGTSSNSKAASVSLSRSSSEATVASSEEHLLLMEAGTDQRGPSVPHESVSYSVDTYNVAHNAMACTRHSIMPCEQPSPAVLKNESYLDACSTVFPNAMPKYEVVLSHANCSCSRELNQTLNKNSWFTTEALNDVAGALGLDRNQALPSTAHSDGPLHCVECDQTWRSQGTHPASSIAKHRSELALPRENARVQGEYSGSSHVRLCPNQTQDKNPAIPSTAEDSSRSSPTNAPTPPFTAQNNDLEHPRSSNLVWPFTASPCERTSTPIPLSANHWLPKQVQDFSFPTTVGRTDLAGSDQYQQPPHVPDPTAFFRAAENKLRQPQLPSCSGTPQSVTMTRTALTAPLPQALRHTTAQYQGKKQTPGYPATNMLTAPTRVGESNPQHARHQTATPVVQSTEKRELERVMSALTEYRFRNRRLRDTLFENMLSLLKLLDDCERIRRWNAMECILKRTQQ